MGARGSWAHPEIAPCTALRNLTNDLPAAVATRGQIEASGDELQLLTRHVGAMTNRQRVHRLKEVRFAGAGRWTQVRDVPLTDWVDQRLQLRLAAWHERAPRSPVVRVARLRLHRCGDAAPWGF